MGRFVKQGVKEGVQLQSKFNNWPGMKALVGLRIIHANCIRCCLGQVSGEASRSRVVFQEDAANIISSYGWHLCVYLAMRKHSFSSAVEVIEDDVDYDEDLSDGDQAVMDLHLHLHLYHHFFVTIIICFFFVLVFFVFFIIVVIIIIIIVNVYFMFILFINEKKLNVDYFS